MVQPDRALAHCRWTQYWWVLWFNICSWTNRIGLNITYTRFAMSKFLISKMLLIVSRSEQTWRIWKAQIPRVPQRAPISKLLESWRWSRKNQSYHCRRFYQGAPFLSLWTSQKHCFLLFPARSPRCTGSVFDRLAKCLNVAPRFPNRSLLYTSVLSTRWDHWAWPFSPSRQYNAASADPHIVHTPIRQWSFHWTRSCCFQRLAPGFLWCVDAGLLWPEYSNQ